MLSTCKEPSIFLSLHHGIRLTAISPNTCTTCNWISTEHFKMNLNLIIYSAVVCMQQPKRKLYLYIFHSFSVRHRACLCFWLQLHLKFSHFTCAIGLQPIKLQRSAYIYLMYIHIVRKVLVSKQELTIVGRAKSALLTDSASFSLASKLVFSSRSLLTLTF